MTIPPHSSHRIQPLDVTFYKPLKTAYNVECDKYLKSHPGEKITTKEIAEIFNKAYSRIATPEKAIKGFETTGIYPINPDVFSEDDFVAAENIRNHQNTIPTQQENDILENSTIERTEEKNEISFRDILYMPSSSKAQLPVVESANRKQHAEIFTSTPNKEQLEEKENRKREKLGKENIRNQKIVKQTKRVLDVDGLTKTIICNDNKKCKVGLRRPNISRTCKSLSKIKNIIDSDDSESPDESSSDVGANEEACLVCGEFGKNEIWVRCTSCGQWAHKACTNTEKKNYVCDYCE